MVPRVVVRDAPSTIEEERAMSQVSYEQSSRTAGGTGAEPLAVPPRRSGWTGWAIFAGIVLFLTGVFHATSGLVALFNDDVYLVSTDRLAVTFDYTAWGWIHLILGSLVAIAGIAIFKGQVWGRAVGVVLAGLSAFANLLFIPAFPLWSLLIIAMDVLVIYALCVHGGELAD
jgi:hypothetical protein